MLINTCEFRRKDAPTFHNYVWRLADRLLLTGIDDDRRSLAKAYWELRDDYEEKRWWKRDENSPSLCVRKNEGEKKKKPALSANEQNWDARAE